MIAPPIAASIPLPSLESIRDLFELSPINKEETEETDGILQESITTGPISPEDDDAIIILSKVAVVKWNHCSRIPGDLVLRIQNATRTICIDILDCGLKTIAQFNFDDIDFAMIDPSGEIGESRHLLQCGPCGERFATDIQCKSHQDTCPLYQRGSSLLYRKVDKGQTYGIHLSLKRSPTWYKECDINPLYPLSLIKCNDITNGELNKTGQFSLYTRHVQESDLCLNLVQLLQPIHEQSQQMIAELQVYYSLFSFLCPAF